MSDTKVIWDAGISDLGKFLALESGLTVSLVKNYREHCMIHTEDKECRIHKSGESEDRVFIAGNAISGYISVYVIKETIGSGSSSHNSPIKIGQSDIRDPKSWPKVHALIKRAVKEIIKCEPIL